MEMCYNGAMVMPSSYAVMDQEEMTYIEGGKLSWSTAKKYAKMALIAVVGYAAGRVRDALVDKAFLAAAPWVKNAFETAILVVMCYPGKVAAVAAGVAILGAAGYAVYKVGKKKKYW